MHGQPWPEHQRIAILHHVAGLPSSERHVFAYLFLSHVICTSHLHVHTPGKHVVFGRVIRGFDDVVTKIAQVTTDEKDRPTVPVAIINCGELELRKKAAPPRSCPFCYFVGVTTASYLWLFCLVRLPLAEERSVSASESEEDEEERSHKRHKRRRRSRSPSDAVEDDSGKRHKRKHKHKHKHRKEDSPSRSGKVEPVLGERKETEEEYDARLEREENERLAAERKHELERLSRQHEQEPPSTNGVRFKGTTTLLFLQLSFMMPSQDGEE